MNSMQNTIWQTPLHLTEYNILVHRQLWQSSSEQTTVVNRRMWHFQHTLQY